MIATGFLGGLAYGVKKTFDSGSIKELKQNWKNISFVGCVGAGVGLGAKIFVVEALKSDWHCLTRMGSNDACSNQDHAFNILLSLPLIVASCKLAGKGVNLYIKHRADAKALAEQNKRDRAEFLAHSGSSSYISPGEKKAQKASRSF